MNETTQQLVTRRERILGPGNTLFYDDPVHVVKGEGAWLYGPGGEQYLDCYNNVPCVGHCHPRIVATLSRQAALLNTHTRYLNEHILEYGEALLSRFDDSLDRMALACTGSEANDLALRMARCYTGGNGIICTNATYHGNTTAVSQLTTEREPIGGRDDNVRRVPWPDTYRPIADLPADKLADAYADEVRRAIESLDAAGIQLAAMIVCPIFANEGLPNVLPGYLDKAVAHVRNAGGVYIVDEVQSGFGRTGRWWGHLDNGPVPDIVTLGKPMGAGHPISGVIARAELNDHYRHHEPYFNTTGGNPVSCAVAREVLNVIDDEGLVENAAGIGAYLAQGLAALQSRHQGIGDVRGTGLFFAIELVSDAATKEPDAARTHRVANAMRQRGVLLSNMGEFGSVLKIRPPLCFSKEHADLLLDFLDDALAS